MSCNRSHLACDARTSRLSSEGPPGAQVVGLYEAAEDGTNEAGWRLEDTLRVAVVVTGSRFAEASGFDSAVRGSTFLMHLPNAPLVNSSLQKNEQSTKCIFIVQIRTGQSAGTKRQVNGKHTPMN